MCRASAPGWHGLFDMQTCGAALPHKHTAAVGVGRQKLEA